MPFAREAIIVVDLGFGDQGKGGVTDFLTRARSARVVVRYNGGAQAAHNVVTADGRHHTFAQFGAGMFVPGVETWLSKYMAIQPWAMTVEADYLARAGVTDAFARTRISREAPVITPFHRAANRLRERARGDARHGSCGVGVGETIDDSRTLPPSLVVRAGDLHDAAGLTAKLARVQEHKRAQLAALTAALRGRPDACDDIATLDDAHTVGASVQALERFCRDARVVDEASWGAVRDAPGAIVFEGAQGVLLDEWRGFHPYTTWSTCTPDNAREMLVGYDGVVVTLGVVRAYATRHGAGPFVTEDAELAARVRDVHNATDPWQGGFRVGHFDAVATRYAMAVSGGVDALAVTCLDRLRDESSLRVANAYLIDGARVDALPIGPREDLDHQSALTQQLLRATPLYEVTTAAGDVAAHLSAIEAHTARVAITSHGLTADDKRLVGALPGLR